MHIVQAVQSTRVTPFADQFFRPGERLLSRFSALDKTRWPLLWVASLFLLQTIPATLIRASNLEEGRIIAMARGAMEDGHWLTPFVYGQRFAERPVLLSWMAALFGHATGEVTLWSLRIPHLFFFLAGAVLIYRLLRMHVLLRRKAERHVGDQVVMRVVAVAITAPGNAGDQLGKVEKPGLGLAENNPRHGQNAIHRHQRGQDVSSSRAKRVTGNDRWL